MTSPPAYRLPAVGAVMVAVGRWLGGGAVTVMVAVPDFPSLVPVIDVWPAAIPLANPFPSTVARSLLPLDQVTARPVMRWPFASASAAAICCVSPTCTLVGDGVTTT